MLKLLQTALHNPQTRRAWRWTCTALFVAVGTAALTPGDMAPTVTASDKIDHLLAFAALSATALLAMAPGPRRSIAAAASMCSYGVVIEVLQTQVAGRSAEFQDVLADAVGAALGVAVIVVLRHWVRASTP